MRTAFGLFTFLLVINTASSQAPSSFCDLIRNADKFNGKHVIIRATYRYGFEWQQLYCMDCLDKGKAWLEIPTDLDKSSEKEFRKMPKYAGIVNVTVEGTFVTGSTYGHENGYRYKIIAHSIRNVSVIQKGMKSLAEERLTEQRFGCGGTNPR